jgi:hypothetical protein
MRQALPIIVVVTLLGATVLTATVVDVVAAGVKTAAVGNHLYNAASTSGISIALPSGMKSFPELPQ